MTAAGMPITEARRLHKGRTFTADEFYAVSQSPEYYDRIVELIDGEMIELPLHGWVHGLVASSAAFLVGRHARDNNLGIAMVGGVGYIAAGRPDGRDTVYGLDCAFLSKERHTKPLSDGWLEPPLDLAIEVVEYCDSANYIHYKILQLLRSGVGSVWAVYPESRSVAVHSGTRSFTLGEAERLEAGDALPGFSAPVASFFAQLS